MLSIVEKLFKSWNSEISYCHWKSNEHLEEGLNGTTDLDLLVSIDDKSKAESVLLSNNFLFCKSQFGSHYPNVDDWIGFDSNTGTLVHLHIHFNIVTGHRGLKEYNLPWTEDALRNRKEDKSTGVFVMEPNLELMTLYTRIGLKAGPRNICLAKLNKFVLDHDYLVEILYLKKKYNPDILKIYLKKYYKQYADQMFFLIEKDLVDSKTFLQIKKLSEKAMKPYRRYSYPILTILKPYYLSALYVRSYLKNKGNCIVTRKVPFHGRGMSIAFIGQDGSGKSTVTKDIQKWLAWKLDVVRYYMGSGDGFNTWEQTVLSRMPQSKILSPVKAYLYLSTTLSVASRRLKNIKKTKKYIEKGVVVIYDRFPQNTYPGINDGAYIREQWIPLVNNKILRYIILLLASVEEKKVKKACEDEPEIVFKLMLPVEESMKRKPDENIDIVKRKHDIITSLSYTNAEVYNIDATQAYEDELLIIKRIIWNHIQK